MSNAPSNGVVIRDLCIFLMKLFLDGLKDVGVFWIAMGAVALDLVFPMARRGQRFYSVMHGAERFDRWLNLYGASQHAGENEDGLFGESDAGSATMLGRLEEIVIGRKQAGDARM
jgi:hypothetical protein